MGRGNFEGKGRPIVKYGDTAIICAKTAEPIDMPFRLRAQVGTRNHVLDGYPDRPWIGAILRGEGAARPEVYSDSLS